MKKILFLITMIIFCGQAFSQTYINEMSKEEVERDCYIEGAAAYNNQPDKALYEDDTYAQRASMTSATAFIFNRELFDNKHLTGFRINICFRLVDNMEQIGKLCKIEYSTDEETYHAIPDMKTEITYKDDLGEGYWTDVYFQAALPTNVVEIKVTLMPYLDIAEWVPCFRRTEIFYQGGTAYSYMTPPNPWTPPTEVEGFEAGFEDSESFIVSVAGSNQASSATVVENTRKEGINTSDKVVKISQIPATEEDPWEWGNGDWFGATVAIKANEGDTEGQLTKITEDTKYLHIFMLREGSASCGLETFGGEQIKTSFEYTSNGRWQDMVVDLSDYVGLNFTSLFIQPNLKFQTNNVQEEEITYIDNVHLSSSPDPIISGMNNAEIGSFKVWGETDRIMVSGAEGSIIEIYSLQGVMVKKLTQEYSVQQIDIPSGLYIVKIGNYAAKTLVK